MIKKGFRIIFFLNLLLVFTITSKAQLINVVASSGGYFEGNRLAISFTIGESVIETLQTGNVSLTQGFQQPNLVITALDDFTNQKLTIQAYPNPATDFVNLNTNVSLPSGSYYRLTDIKGSLLVEKIVSRLTTKISFLQLRPSVYFLSVRCQDKIIKTFKIIKQ